MSKKNRYILVGIFIAIITVLVTIYSTYTYSMKEENEDELDNIILQIDPNETLLKYTFSGLVERVSKNDQVERYEPLVMRGEGSEDQDLAQYTLSNVPDNRVQVGPTCWAFSTINAIETTIANSGVNSSYGKSIRINPYHMIHALEQKIGNDNNPYGYRDEKNNGGGTSLNTLIYLTSGLGFTTKSSYFYNQSSSGSSNYSQGSLSLNSILNSDIENFQIKKIQIIPGIDADYLNSVGEDMFAKNEYVKNKITDIKRLISSGHGVTITSRSTQYDENPCYRDDTHSAYCPIEFTDLVGAHMTLIVGWDDNYSLNNFKKTVGDKVNNGPKADGAWIIRNSYSYGGYYYISYYDYTSLYNSNFAVTSVAAQKDYDYIYQYNPSGCDADYNCFELDSVESDVVNVYTKPAQSNRVEQVKSISFYADRVSNGNSVKIYLKEGNIGNLSSLFSQENLIGEVNITANGFYTYDLTPEQVKKITTNKFYVGLRPIHRDTLKIQRKSNQKISNLADVGIQEGVSYYKSGNTYKDLKNYRIPSTAFIKVYTKKTDEIMESERVNYTVKYYLEKLDGTYELKDTKSYVGALGDTAVLENYDGFIKPTGVVLQENTTLVEYKYKRKSYTVTLSKVKGISDVNGGGSYKHGQSVTINATIDTGYTWSRWIGENNIESQKYTFTMPMKDMVFTAIAMQDNPSGISISGISIKNCPTSSIKVGSSVQLKTTITPSDATNKTVVWTVPSFNVVTVNGSGKIKAVSAGSVIVTVTTVQGGYQDSCKIVVSDEIKEENLSSSSNTSNVVKIDLDQKEVSIIEGGEYKLKATVTGSSKKVIWSSSNDKVATVDNGLIKAVSVGETTITAKLEGTSKTVQAKVKVITDKDKGIRFESEQIDVYLNRDKEIKIITTPTDMVIEKIEYVLENEDMAMITNNIITGLKLGSTKLNVTVNDKYKASAVINVYDEPLQISISGYNFNFEEDTYEYELQIEKEKKLKITSNKEITIDGNVNLRNGSIIKIINSETNREYKIKIIKKNNYMYIFIGIISILLIINVVRIISKKKKM